MSPLVVEPGLNPATESDLSRPNGLFQLRCHLVAIKGTKYGTREYRHPSLSKTTNLHHPLEKRKKKERRRNHLISLEGSKTGISSLTLQISGPCSPSPHLLFSHRIFPHHQVPIKIHPRRSSSSSTNSPLLDSIKSHSQHPYVYRTHTYYYLRYHTLPYLILGRQFSRVDRGYLSNIECGLHDVNPSPAHTVSAVLITGLNG